jgi:hypothetical protein
VPPSPAMSEFERSARRRERHRVVACLHTGPGRAALMVAVAALVARQLAQTVVAGCRTTGVLASSVGSRPPSRHGARMAGDHMIAGRRRRSPPRSSAGCGAARSATGADSLSPCHPAPDAQRILRLHATGWERLGRRGHRRGPRHQCRRRPSPAPARPRWSRRHRLPRPITPNQCRRRRCRLPPRGDREAGQGSGGERQGPDTRLSHPSGHRGR